MSAFHSKRTLLGGLALQKLLRHPGVLWPVGVFEEEVIGGRREP
jgi:hypothetical protein